MFIVLIIYKFIGAINIPRLPAPERSVAKVKFGRQELKGAERKQACSRLPLPFYSPGPREP